MDPASGRISHFRHDPNDPSSLGDNDIKATGEDRAGTFWVAIAKLTTNLIALMGR